MFLNKSYLVFFIFLFISKNLVAIKYENKEFSDIDFRLNKLEEKLDLIIYDLSIKDEKSKKESESLQSMKELIIKVDKSTHKNKLEKILHCLDLLISKKALIGGAILVIIGINLGIIKIETVAKYSYWILKKSIYLCYLIIKYLSIMGFNVFKNFAKKNLNYIKNIKDSFLAEKAAGYKGDFYNWLVLHDKDVAAINTIYW